MATQRLTLLPTAPTVDTAYVFPASGGGNTYKISTGELAGWISSKDVNLKSNNYTVTTQDQKSLMSFYGGGSYNLVIPSHSEDPIPVGTIIDVTNNGTSIVYISATQYSPAVGFQIVGLMNYTGQSSVNENSVSVGLGNPSWGPAIEANPTDYEIVFNGGLIATITGASGTASAGAQWTFTGTWPANVSGAPLTIRSKNYSPGNVGVSLNSPEGFYVVNYGLASLIKVANNQWVLSGNLSYHPDRYFGNVGLLAHMSGTDGASSFVDSSNSPKTMNVYGEVKTLSTQYKYGPTSAYFNGGWNALTLGGSDDFNFGSGDFTIELWTLVDAYNANSSRLIQSRDGDYHSGFNIGIGPNGMLGVYVSSNGNNWDVISDATSLGIVPLNTWTHIAFTRKNGVFLIFVNGNIVYSKTSSASLYYNSTDTIIIGGQTNAYGPNRSLNGYIDEVRITKGEGRYSQPFQLNNIPYPDLSVSFNVQPKLVPGLRLWLDANDSTSLYDSVSGGSNVVADSSIARWEDVSGENNHAIQNDSDKRPLRKVSSRNSKDTVLFDGSNDCFVVPNFWLQSHFSVFIVQTSLASSGTKFWLEHGPNLNSNPGFYFQGINGAIWAVRRGSNIHEGDTNTLANGTDWIGDSWSLASFVYNGAGYVYKNGVLVTSQSHSGSTLSNTILTDTLNIASRNQNSIFLNGSIAEIIIYDKPLPNLYRIGIEKYLKNKWNIS
jgi:hypothetical protein